MTHELGACMWACVRADSLMGVVRAFWGWAIIYIYSGVFSLPDTCNTSNSLAYIYCSDTKRLEFVLIDRSWNMATSRYAGMPVSESGPLVRIRPLPKNLPCYVRRVRMCDGTRCRGPDDCTFAHNEFELNQWNVQLQQGIYVSHVYTSWKYKFPAGMYR